MPDSAVLAVTWQCILHLCDINKENKKENALKTDKTKNKSLKRYFICAYIVPDDDEDADKLSVLELISITI